MPTQAVTPSADQLAQARMAIDAYVRSIDANPDRRDGAYPYYQFHEAGQPIQGTVLLFHGFSAKPHQLWRLADYLFQNGFNVYQASIAGHPLLRPDQNWPQVDLVPEIANPLKAKIQADPVLQTYLGNLSNNPAMARRPSYLQRLALMKRLVFLEPRLLDIIRAIEAPDDPDFDRYFISSHQQYLSNAQARLAELDSLPDPIYTVGLSVGGAVALGLAASRPNRIQRVVAYAPLLKVISDRRQYVNLAGPLDISETGWDPNLRFPVGCFTAADRFGSSVVLSPTSVQQLRQVPTFLVLTENEDAADLETNQAFFRQIGGTANGHYSYLYPARDMVPHPMVDPTEVSQGMSNRFWQSLYQETFRFLNTGKVDLSNMGNLEQNPDVPQVPPVS
jgi:pimeloyl-ACP methyl ester carboxylesterase